MEALLVSVIVLNWNRKPILKSCLDSILNQTYHPLEILLVDNGSTDGSADYVQENFPNVHVIANEVNLGFCGGNNVGIRNSHGEFIALVNNDARLDPSCIEEMMETMRKEPRIGAVASKILLEDTPTHLDAAGIAVCLDGLSIGRGRLEKAENYTEEAEVFFASDCACLYRRRMLEDIGLYDEDFFAYAEETDLGWRARLKGWKTFYSPKAVVFHSHSSTLGVYHPFKVFLVERNRIWVALKNFPWPFLLRGFFFTLQRYLFQSYSAFVGSGAAGEFAKKESRWKLAWILIKAHVSAWAALPKMIKKRKEILGTRRISDQDMGNLFKLFGLSAQQVAFKC